MHRIEGWTKLAAGCHWQKGPYTVSTIATGDGQRYGYVLVRDRQTLGEYLTWNQVRKLVEEGA